MNISKVLISDAVDKAAVDVLLKRNIEVDVKTKLTPSELIQIIGNYDALIVRSATRVTKEVIDAGKKLKVIGRAGVGVDNIDVEAATQNRVLVINAPGGNTIAAAELTCIMILSLARPLVAACTKLKTGAWDKESFKGSEVMGKTLAIIGLGRIGREVARRMQAFNMRTIGYDPFVTPDVARSFGVEFMELEKIWPLADYITLHVPLIESTRNLINPITLSKCKKGVMIINCCRGGTVSETALVEALNSGQAGGAGLDVFEEEPCKFTELLQHPKVICTPHLGASTKEAQIKVAEEISLQFLTLMDGDSLAVPGAVNANQIS
ncbi:D-3-phosphoglycerate dehydrogenase-like [Panonychus citri]|uniref:D-3-phosphoglycerate dehydrogenase-like n=1 Tax=Panonychus citri TaxID=50023 RepID=UPI00230745D7|nr:D-3-phosphoglycerate dehydrogenase-like [Panonychus citri]